MNTHLYNIKHLALCLVLLMVCTAASAETPVTRSRRSSLCSMLVKHSEQKFAKEIEEQFLHIPISDRFNEHNLSIRVANVDAKKVPDADVDDFVSNNKIASRLVARWLDRDILTGACTVDTIRARGLWDATTFDAELAKRTARGTAMLEDAGEELIGNTWLLMNEVRYIDKSKKSKVWGLIGGIAMAAATMASGGSSQSAADNLNSTSAIISSYKGFKVRITTRLYRLVWDDETANMVWT